MLYVHSHANQNKPYKSNEIYTKYILLNLVFSYISQKSQVGVEKDK